MTCSHNCTVDVDGRPFCICPRGYQLIGSDICQDINECTTSNLNLCSYKEGCNNTEGGFTCSCLAGQKLDNDGRTCIDCAGDTWGYQCANQCACGFGSDRCDPKYGCICKPPYTGQYCTEDVDECTTGQQICSLNEICVNKLGSAECQCQVGFYLKNGTCSDIDECSQGTHLCQETCINVEGGYNCSCSAEKILQDDGYSCASRSVGCHKVLSSETGEIMSPNYPLNNPDNTNCSWTVITSIANSYISLSFQTYKVEGCPYDFIEVYDGSSKLANLLGRFCNSLPDTIKSTGSSLHIVFVSDESENRKGFLASYVAQEHCRDKNCSHTCQVTSTNPRSEVCSCPDWMKLNADETQCSVTNACNTTVQASSGYIVSPNYPYNYPNNIYCHWIIQAGSHRRVNLSFSDIVMEGGEGCPYDYISINDGPNTSTPLLGRYCNADILPNVLSSKAFLHISFKSDGSASSRGFKAAFSTVE
ncbi:Dorsal-ventral patterning tolloid-like protein 1 [Bulinus truncatus]|nr:Dorsal-ventral patterning tolloid-like protein 1 [Bulinus truncatus]